MQITEIITDDTMRELREHGSPEFPFEYYLDDFGRFPDRTVAWHWHREFEWCYSERGSIDCMVGSERLRLEPGDAVFINSRAIHAFSSGECGLMPNILFRPEFIAPAGSAVYEEYVRPVMSGGRAFIFLPAGDGISRGIISALKHVFDLTCGSAPPDKLEVSIAVSQLWKEFVSGKLELFRPAEGEKSMLLQSRMRSMLQYISENYREKITLEEIASAASVSKSEALRCFRSCIGTSPVKYLISYRLNRAGELLRASDDSVTSVAAAVGFDNVSYFVRAFTTEFGVTPGKLRKTGRE